jgi:hypothetical protein
MSLGRSIDGVSQSLELIPVDLAESGDELVRSDVK